MKKIISILITITLLITLSACGASENRQETADDKKTSARNTETVKNEEGKILIAYFTWADNTEVDNPDSVEVDASTSASVLPPGNVALMAAWIQQEIGGDEFSIKVNDLYSSNYDECLDRAADEKADNARPKLTEGVENIEEYETIFLGYPNWWYAVPMPILSFIDDNNLSGKKVILFCSHGTGGLADSVNTIAEELPTDCEVEENVIGIYRDDIPNGQKTIQDWLNEIGY